MKNLGQVVTARVQREVPMGLMLSLDDQSEVLLPSRYCPRNHTDTLDVFLYQDSQGRAIATTLKPKAEVGQFAYLKAIENSEYGTFLDWGIDKDLLVPFGEQHRPMVVGKAYLVYVYINKADGRIVGSSKIDKFLKDDKPHNFRVGQTVQLIIANSTDLGFKAIVDHSHWGVVYKNEVHGRLSFGQSLPGFIKYVRPDGKIDLSIQEAGAVRNKNTETILRYLRANDHFMPLNDKSEPALIQQELGMSKAAFKKAIGALYKRRVIDLEQGGVRLLPAPE